MIFTCVIILLLLFIIVWYETVFLIRIYLCDHFTFVWYYAVLFSPVIFIHVIIGIVRYKPVVMEFDCYFTMKTNSASIPTYSF